MAPIQAEFAATAGRGRRASVMPPPFRQPERRDAASREWLLRRVRAEFNELRGLTLTLAQGQRLFGLRDDICRRVFEGLVVDGFLRRTPTQSFARTRITP